MATFYDVLCVDWYQLVRIEACASWRITRHRIVCCWVWGGGRGLGHLLVGGFAFGLLVFEFRVRCFDRVSRFFDESPPARTNMAGSIQLWGIAPDPTYQQMNWRPVKVPARFTPHRSLATTH